MTVDELVAGDTIWVVSWAYWNGADQGGGGFWWFHTEREALSQLEHEKFCWSTSSARVRVLQVELPSGSTECFGHGQDVACTYDDPITCWLDANIDGLEVIWPAHRVWINYYRETEESA